MYVLYWRYLFNLGPESGANLADYRVPGHEHKRWNNELTERLVKDEAKWRKYVRDFMLKLLKAACAAINARINLTIHYGVDNDGKVHGAPVEGKSQELVSTFYMGHMVNNETSDLTQKWIILAKLLWSTVKKCFLDTFRQDSTWKIAYILA